MEDKEKDGLKITNQFRAKGGMTYDLKCKGARLTLVVTPRTTEGDSGEWRVEARVARPLEDPIAVAEWGPTRIEALRAVGRAWSATPEAQGFGMFDWEAIAQALISVRAL